MPEEEFFRGDRFAEIAGAIGRLTAGLEEAHRRSERLEASIEGGLKRLEVAMKEMLMEMRERYHDRTNELQRKLLDLDNDLMATQRRVTKLEFWRVWVLGVAAALGTISSVIVALADVWLRH